MSRQDTARKQNMNNEVFLCILRRGETLRVPVNDILYIDSRDRKIFIYTSDNVYEYNDKIDHVTELLEAEGFIRCHQSFVVRQSAVSVVRRDKLVVGEKEIPISRKYKEDVKSLFMNNLAPRQSEKVFLNEQRNVRYGKMICVSGPYSGKLFQVVPEQEILIGRDGECCDIVFNLPRISRRHLRIIFHEKKSCYELMDLSTNGTFINGEIRIEKNVRYEVELGESVMLGDGLTVLKLE